MTAAPSPETILLVEDDEMVRGLLELTLRRDGYLLHVATDADEALSISKQLQRTLALLVTDINLPQMGGRELAEHIRARHPVTRVLFISGHLEEPSPTGAVNSDFFLQKPFTPSMLSATVKAVLGKL